MVQLSTSDAPNCPHPWVGQEHQSWKGRMREIEVTEI